MSTNMKLIYSLIVIVSLYCCGYCIIRKIYTTNQDGELTMYNEGDITIFFYYLHQPLIFIDHQMTGRVVELGKWRVRSKSMINHKNSAQQGDAPEPASPAR